MRNKTLLRVVQVLGFISAMALLPAAQALQITMTLPDCPSGQALSFSSSNNALSCVGTAPQPTPGNCSITANPVSTAQNPISPGTSVTLTALCTTGDQPISYSWNIGTLGPIITVGPSTTTTYTVTPSNAAGPGPAFSSTVFIVGSSVIAPSGCSVAQTPNTNSSPVAAGTSVNLSVSCSGGNAPTSCAWSSNIPTTSACSVSVSAPAVSTSYTVIASNSGGPAPQASTTIFVTGAVIAPSGCSIGQSPNTNITPVAPGTSVNLNVSCSGGSAPTSCAWTGGISSTSCSVNLSAPSANTSYSATASNSAGPAPQVSTTVQVSGQPAGQNYCAGADQIINVNWPLDGQVRPGTNGFGNQKIAFRIVVPATFSPALNINHLGFAKIFEQPGAAVTFHEFSVSRNSCDFQSGDYLYYDSGNTAPSVAFTANNPNGYRSIGASFNVQSGDTFFVNVRNAVNGNPSCPNSTCEVYFDFAVPNRY